MNIIGILDSVGRDLRYALRGLARRPAFTFAAVLTLALGIGATTAIFSVVYSVLIKPLVYPNSDELVRIRHTYSSGDLAASSPLYLTYRNENRTFADIGVWREDSATLTDRGEPERVRALLVSHGTLQALGVQPLRGRWFTEEEHELGADGPAPVILSHAFWRQRFGGDGAAIGRELSVDSQPAQVVGIMPPDFAFVDMTPPPDVILAVRFEPREMGWFRYEVLARLKQGVTLDSARADLERMLPLWFDPIPAAFREGMGTITPLLRPLQDDMVGSVASALWVLMGAIGAVLLIACANIANLMLVRADARRQELAMRAALGARPMRIARELLVESLVLGAGGGVLGVLLAYLGLRGLIAIGPSDLPRLQEIAVHPPVLAFAVAVSLASTLVFGSITALKHALHIDTHAGAARGASAGRERNATRSALVVVQVALALVLVVSAGLMIRSFQALRDIDPGFSDPATIQTAGIWAPGWPNVDAAGALQWTRTQHEIVDRIAAIPGVASAGFVNALPIEWAGSFNNSGFAVEGATLAANERPRGFFKFVSPGYFDAMGTRMIAGRQMTWADLEAGGRVVVISAEFARQLATEPGGAVGKRIRFAGDDQGDWREVIGVVQSIHEQGLYEGPPPMVYWPAFMAGLSPDEPEIGSPVVTLVIRSERAGTASFVDEIRQAVRSVSASIPVAEERTMRAVYAGSLARTSFTLVMLAIAGGMALLLGVVGIYGVIAYVVSQRAREIGIRSALGAEPRQLKKMFLLHGLALSTVGAVLGVCAAAGLARLLSSVLFGIGPMDPTAYVAALAVTIAAAALASYVPARRAATIDPIETLRAE
jgi:putative ABC transport system permease protein